MREEELTTWLGDHADEVSVEQHRALLAAASRIEARWRSDEHADLRQAAFAAAVRVTLGDASLEQISAAWKTARAGERTAHAALTGALIATPDTPAALAIRAGVARTTVHKALGTR